MRYKQKVDLGIKVLLIGISFMFIPFIFIDIDEFWMFILLTIIMMVIDLPLLYGYVELGDEEITIRLGYFRRKIRYDEVKEIKETKSLMSSSTTLSRDRVVLIRHNTTLLKGSVDFSVENKEEVLSELRYRCKNLNHDDVSY